MKVKAEPYAIPIIPINEQSSGLFTKEYRYAGFVSSAVNVGANPLDRPATRLGGSAAPGKDIQDWTGGQQLVTRADRARFPQGSGVPFPPGRAPISSRNNRSIVRNTEENLELVDALVEQSNVAGTKQVEIKRSSSRSRKITLRSSASIGY